MQQSIFKFILILALIFVSNTKVWAQHGYALWGKLKYSAGFSHFDYANINAPQQGELRLVSNLRTSSFDKFNPFTIKGNSPAYLSNLMFDSLLTGSLDETASAYGLLAQEVKVSADGLSATFVLRPNAKFHNDQAVSAQDVLYSFETLNGPFTSPGYKTLLADVASAKVLNPSTIVFYFKKANRELPLTVGGLPIFSRSWGLDKTTQKSKPFDQIIQDPPIGSGPYKIGAFQWGKDITYVKNKNYWAKDLNVRKGHFNFDKITVKIYKDNTARLEALKAGEFDLMRFFSAGDWARRVNGKRFDSGELVKKEFAHQQPSGFQSYVFNTRKPLLQDVRVRQALGLALDYEWMNRQLFYNSYARVNGMFGNTDCQATGLPSPQEMQVLQPFKNTTQLPPSVWGPMALAPRTDGQFSLRQNLRQAKQLLADAGWTVQNGVLKNAKGQVFSLEYLDSSESSIRVISPWMRNLEKLGVQLQFRSVDFSLYQQRLQKFDFDITSIAYGGTHNPGQEYVEMFGSKAADIEDSSNLSGIKNPAIDALLNQMTSASSLEELKPICRVLDRSVAHLHLMVPQWFGNSHRMAYNAQRLTFNPTVPPYISGEGWVIENWWSK